MVQISSWKGLPMPLQDPVSQLLAATVCHSNAENTVIVIKPCAHLWACEQPGGKAAVQQYEALANMPCSLHDKGRPYKHLYCLAVLMYCIAVQHTWLTQNDAVTAHGGQQTIVRVNPAAGQAEIPQQLLVAWHAQPLSCTGSCPHLFP